MERQTLSLNGVWEVVFDDKEKLKADCFKKRPKTYKVNVPGIWEEARPGYDGVGFYRRTFDLPKSIDPAQQIVHLKFGAVNYFAEVFLNGRKIGEHEGGYSPFTLDATKAVQRDANELVVRVIDPPRRRKIQGFRSGAPLSQGNIPSWKAGWYFTFGGIWQDVDLYATAPIYLADVFFQPQPDLKTAVFVVTVENRGPAGEFELDIAMTPKRGSEQTGLTLRQTVRVAEGTNTFTLTGAVENPHLWSLDDPFLYTVTTTLTAASGQDLDATQFTTGMRFFTVEDGVFKLNGRRIALRGFLQQGIYPRHIVFPDTMAEARAELMLLKKNGMNFVRAHLKPTPQMLDIADEIGILVHSEPPIGWIENTPETLPRGLHEVEGMVTSQRNRACIVMWGLLNEAGHYRTFTPDQIAEFTNALTEHCRTLDPTRLTISNSGGDIGGHATSGVDATVGAYLPYATSPTRVHDLHAYCGLPLPESAVETYRNQAGGEKFAPDGAAFASETRPEAPPAAAQPVLYVSEFGAFENPPDYKKVLARYSPRERKLGLEDYQQHKNYFDSLQAQFKRAKLGQIFGSLDNYIRDSQELYREDIRVIVSAMRANPRNSGWVFTQLADASGELFGAVDIWRQPRRWFKDLAAACQTPLIVPHLTRRVLAAGETFGLNVRLVNEDRTGDRYTWQVTIRRGKQVVHSEYAEVTARGWVQEVLDISFDAPATPGRYAVEATLKCGTKVLSRNDIRFTVIAPRQAPVERVGMFDMDNEIRPTLEALGVPRIDKGGNNYRHKNVPCVYVMRAGHPVGLLTEYNKQLRRIVTLGGAALVLEPITPMLYDELLPKVVRLSGPMRNLVYMRPSPIWDGLPTSGGFMDYDFADLFGGRRASRHNADDILALGGTSLCGGLCAHMWTDPEIYQWGSIIDEVPLGRGRLIFCQFSLVQQAKTNPVAARLLGNLLRYTASFIKPGGEERLLSRCIDPV